MADDVVTVVSGLPRSGTSMMMSMLRAGGLPLLVDGVRTADEDNPRGYYEFERVKRLPGDTEWLDDARGKVVKVISDLLVHLPAERTYKVIFMRRQLDEVLQSQGKMLGRRGEASGPDAGEMRRIYMAHLDEIFEQLDAAAHLDTLYVSYNRLLASPEPQIARICRFLVGSLDAEKMLGAVDKALYRNRA